MGHVAHQRSVTKNREHAGGPASSCMEGKQNDSIKYTLLQPVVSQAGSKQVCSQQYVALGNAGRREKENAMRSPEAQRDGKFHSPQPQNMPIQITQADELPSIAGDGFNAAEVRIQTWACT